MTRTISHEYFHDFDWIQLPPIKEAIKPRPYVAGFPAGFPPDVLRDTNFAHCSFYKGRWNVAMRAVDFHGCNFIECDFTGLTLTGSATNPGAISKSAFHGCDFRAPTLLRTLDCSFFACKFPALRYEGAQGRAASFTSKMLRATTVQPPDLVGKRGALLILDAAVRSGQPLSHEADWRPDVLTPEDYYARNSRRRGRR